MSNVHTLYEEAPMTTIYRVDIKQHEDWHFATCDALPGLFVGNIDYDTVLKNIPECITMLLKHDQDRKVIVKEVPPNSPTLLGQKTYLVTSTLQAA